MLRSTDARRSRIDTVSLMRPWSAVFWVWWRDRRIARVRRKCASSYFFRAPRDWMKIV
ncbi:hypothetical protein M2410_000061 [Stenotrophomonas chelatiphaga]|nr:hypothetical protein [Stenotrophomonas chelatiphaga]